VTCVVAISDGESALIGADSMVLAGDQALNMAGGKIHQIGPWTVGLAGNFRACQQAVFDVQWPAPRNNVMRTLTRIGGKINDTVDDDVGVELIVAHSGRLYILDQSGCVVELGTRHAAIGSGAPFAMGYLHKRTGRPRNLVLGALGAASALSYGVRAPFHVVECI
jgi:ATP-dependent protease HslVU (ClpYQ) peptidase subunit